MRISDWSSDVCSSDLNKNAKEVRDQRNRHDEQDEQERVAPMRLMTHVDVEERNGRERDDRIDSRAGGRHEQFILSDVDLNALTADGIAEPVQKRSEDHTSELQSLMRN